MVAAGLIIFLLGWATGWKVILQSPVIYLAIFASSVWFVLNFTTIGRRVYAVGGNAEAARLSGVNVKRYKILAFVLSGAAAGFAGILMVSQLRSITPAALEGAELSVIAAAILGGTSLYGGSGSIVKTLAGAFMLSA